MELFYLSVTSQMRVVIDKHAAGAAYRHAAGRTEGNGAVQIFFNIDKTIEHRHAFAGWHDEFLKVRFTAVFRIIPLHSERYRLSLFFMHDISYRDRRAIGT